MVTIGGHTFEEKLLGDGCIIDVGCRGFVFADHFLEQGKKVYCIDPDDEVFKDSRQGRIDLNLAISASAGETSYYKNGEATMLREVDPDPTFVHINKKYCNPCKSITMEDLYKITGENVDILKLDCEGAEYIILGETFKPIPKQITVEFHNHCVPKLHKEKYPQIIERLSKYYKMESGVWDSRHGAGNNWWDSLFVRK
jgi:FkbM family methyltransferase